MVVPEAVAVVGCPTVGPLLSFLALARVYSWAFIRTTLRAHGGAYGDFNIELIELKDYSPSEVNMLLNAVDLFIPQREPLSNERKGESTFFFSPLFSLLLRLERHTNG